MNQRALGKTELQVSPIGMGTIQITRLPWHESIRVVRDVHELGINWFDTAQGYLDSELRLGEAFRGLRDNVIIITKSVAGDRKTLLSHVEASLGRLKTDYIDVFFSMGEAPLTKRLSPERMVCWRVPRNLFKQERSAILAFPRTDRKLPSKPWITTSSRLAWFLQTI